MSDSALIARVVATGDHGAFGELVRRHQSAVRHFLRHLTGGNAALADDLAQDCFVQAYQSLGKFRGGSSVSTWLLGIAHNLWRNARRRDRMVPLASEHLDQLGTIDSTAILSDLRHDLTAALRHLSPEEQTALHLAYHQGLTQADIARVLDWPLGTVKTHVNRGLAKLRPLLASWTPTP